MSKEFTRAQHGNEVVDAAYDALKEIVSTEPYIYQRIMNARDPWAEMVKWHQQHSLMSKIGDPSKSDEIGKGPLCQTHAATAIGRGRLAFSIIPPQAPVVRRLHSAKAPAGPQGIRRAKNGQRQAFDSMFTR